MYSRYAFVFDFTYPFIIIMFLALVQYSSSFVVIVLCLVIISSHVCLVKIFKPFLNFYSCLWLSFFSILRFELLPGNSSFFSCLMSSTSLTCFSTFYFTLPYTKYVPKNVEYFQEFPRIFIYII